MLVLGIDPGSHRTGWGIVQNDHGQLTHVASGTIEAGDGDLAKRLARIGEEMDRLVGIHAPQAVAVETVFFARNVRSVLQLGHARGVAMASAARAGVDVFEYTAGQIKQATTGRGRADKDQVQQMVRLILSLDSRPLSLDTSDALAAAICHVEFSSGATAKALSRVSI